MLKDAFSRFWSQQGDWLHCTAHSHHPWPDVTRAAQLQYWDDSVALTDRKWEAFYADQLPRARRHVACEIGWPDATNIVFAPNTHEFVLRLYSCLHSCLPGRAHRVLTTDGEFHSFSRQTRRLEQDGLIEVQRVPTQPFDTFNVRFAAACREGGNDMVWLSHVFFDSGFVVSELEQLVAATPADSLVVVDGYHAFCAVPMDLRALSSRIFYLAGGYKYAMAGENACFLAVPAGCTLEPRDTGWFADFEGLADAQGRVAYAPGGRRFAGATFDLSGLYRFNAVRDWLQAQSITTADIHRHVQSLQQDFLAGLRHLGSPHLPVSCLIPGPSSPRGHFLTFDLTEAAPLEQRLEALRIGVDRRATRVRFGFGAYHDRAFIEQLVERLSGL
jgi:selenocysteine lyase/cysteine desulfurase